jgi:hypothetical protein
MTMSTTFSSMKFSGLLEALTEAQVADRENEERDSDDREDEVPQETSPFPQHSMRAAVGRDEIS